MLEVYEVIKVQPTDLSRLRGALERLLVFVSSPEGRTNANYWAADLFSCLREAWETEVGRSHLYTMPSSQISAVHCTIPVQSPDVVKNVFSTPEQLLARLAAIQVNVAPPNPWLQLTGELLMARFALYFIRLQLNQIVRLQHGFALQKQGSSAAP
jgi:hypothetical protein